MEYIHKKKEEQSRAKQLADQAEARRLKSKMSRQRREERQAAKRAELLKQYAKEDEAADAAK